MRDLLYLAWRYLVYHRFKTAVLVCSITLIVYLPMGLNILVSESASELTARAEATPLLVGAKGSPLELVLNSLYFESAVPPAMRHSEVSRIQQSELANAIPLYTRFRTRHSTIVGTSLDYFAFRELQIDQGRQFGRLGECVLGCHAARLADVAIGVTHTHGPGGEHAHLGMAFTTWLDPQQAIAQAAALHTKLISLRPQYEDDFDQGFLSLKADLEELDSKIAAMVALKRGIPLVFSHPVYQYFTRRYDLNAESVHWEPNEMPAEAMWKDFAALRERHPAAWMIWEGEPDEAIVARLQEMNVQTVVFAPCGNKPSQGDYLWRMRLNIENLIHVFGGNDKRPDRWP